MNAVDATYLAVCVIAVASGALLTVVPFAKLRERLRIAQGQLAAANREIAMMRKARSDASRKGAVTKRAKRIQLPGNA